MRRAIGLLLLGILLASCSPARTTEPAPPPPAVQTAPQATESASKPPERTATPDPATVNALNDQSFQFTKASNWAEAERTAREALALDPQSAAAWFNLGKAQLGARDHGQAANSFAKASGLTGRANVDIQYNLAKSLYLARDLEAAIREAQDGIKRFPTDPDFPKLLAEAKANVPGRLLLEIDIDQDGDVEAIRETADGVQIRDAHGTLLYGGQKLGFEVHQVTPLTMPDGTIVVHVEWMACPSYPQNELLWYNPAVKAIQNAAPKDMCTPYQFDGKDSFTSWYRTYPIATAVVRRWQQGALVEVDSRQVLYGEVRQEILPWVLGEIASSPAEMQGAQGLFTTAALYQRFRAETSGHRWTFTWESDAAPSRLLVAQDESATGAIAIELNQDGVITALSWPPAP